jgi:hypothetical protein
MRGDGLCPPMTDEALEIAKRRAFERAKMELGL